ncbi:MAG: hypothetical protein ABMA01_11225 [Chthoniobacteraceae bacterium]
MKTVLRIGTVTVCSLAMCNLVSAEPRSISGIYPSLATFNDEGECGTGAVVPWADRLWVISYAPHKPQGSSDKLYEITPDLRQIVRPESIGGTPANRMIHRESNQLFIGPYVVDAKGGVRVIPPGAMFGRHTGNARYLTDPANKIYYATMEEGIYEVDVHSLAVTKLWTDEQQKDGRKADLPGYHGKGLYSGQGRLVYANNGDHAKAALKDPTTPSGVLAEWDGRAEKWTVVRRNEFTDVTGPGGIFGNEHPATDPLWSIGWDAKSLILMLRNADNPVREGEGADRIVRVTPEWQTFRLPKVSHSYDGAHGWNTEWPRIREIGEGDLLMTMHGAFWRFPKTFSATNTAGIRPRSAYLKVVGDFCRWGDRVVLGCDDSAKSEFLNKRKVKGGIEGPGQSQSNLWFVDPKALDGFGPAHAGGAVWLREDVKEGDVSEPFLFSGWERRSLHIVNDGTAPLSVVPEIDGKALGSAITVAPGAAEAVTLTGEGEWIRLRATTAGAKVSAHFAYTNPDKHDTEPDAIFNGLAGIDTNDAHLGGIVRARGENKRTLAFAAMNVRGSEATDIGYYELDGALKLKRVDDARAHDYVKAKVAIPRNVIALDTASVLVTDDRGRRWRLPFTTAHFDAPTEAGLLRICREVATERDVFSAYGSIYELPAENADGFAKIRPVATHNRRIMDYCSYRGLLILTGLKPDAKGEHIIRSDDGKAALWAGAIDDLWKLGKPRGHGGPWAKTKVRSGEKSDPFLMWGYDKRTLKLSHDGKRAVTFRVELDLDGTGLWITHKTFEVPPGGATTYEFPAAIHARWLRASTDADCTATVHLVYE